MFQHSGVLFYSNRDVWGNFEYRLVVEVDKELGRYYRALAPKHLGLSVGRYPTHITVVRPGKDLVIPNAAAWGKYQGQKVDFLYEPGVKSGTTYHWLRVVSTRLEDIRLELGLPVEVSYDPTETSYTKPPLGYRKYFHITIGNTKN